MSEMAKTARAAMRAKARARGGFADAQPLSSAAPDVAGRKPPRVARKAGGKVAAKVEGAKSAARADRKPRAKKADGGVSQADMAALGYDGMTPAQVRRLVMRNALRDATGLAGASMPMARTAALATRAAPVAEAALAPAAEPLPSTMVRSAGEAARARPGPYYAEGTVNVSPTVPRIPQGSPRSVFMAANRAAELGLGSDVPSGAGAAVDRGIGTRTDRMDARSPDMVIRAERPAPSRPLAMPSDNMADRLNAISLGQSRNGGMGPAVASEAAQNDAERAIAQRMLDRKAAIDAQAPTDAALGNFKRGGTVKKSLKGRKSKSGKSAGHRAR